MQHEWRKAEQELYSVKEKPAILTIPTQNFITIKGTGNPNEDIFSEKVGVLYSLAYPLKMYSKKVCDYDYVVYPLEGIWSTSNLENISDKDSYEYTIMIRQPDSITKEIFETIVETVQEKKPHIYLEEVHFEAIIEGHCVQVLHKGSFDSEPLSFDKLNEFIESNELGRINCHQHKEVYITDARKTAPEKRKTILRYQVK